MTKLSVCMIVRDEEGYLDKCLSSISGLSDELIVVDTGSTDNSMSVANKFDAKVYSINWNNDFSEARNFSIDKATGEWILILDADETISKKDHNRILEIIENDTYDAYRMDQRTYGNGLQHSFYVAKGDDKYDESKNYGGWISSKIVRLFRNGRGYSYRYKIHEVLEPSIEDLEGNIGDLDVPVHHFTNEKDNSFIFHKINRYLDIGLKQIAETPDDPKPYLEVAHVYMERKDYKNAEALLLKAIKVSPNYPELHNSLSTIYFETNRMLDAERVLQEWLLINDTDIPLYNKLATVSFSKREFDKAERYLKRALLIDDKSLMTYNNYGLLYALSNNPLKAIGMFSKSLKLSPDNLYALVTQGMLYVSLKNYVDSRRVLERALKVDDKDIRVLYHLGVTYAALGQKAKAKKLLLSAQSASPNDPAILNAVKNLG